MASMRKLKRRLARWERYAGRYGYVPDRQPGIPGSGTPWSYGHARAMDAVLIESERRASRLWTSLHTETLTPVGGIL